MFGAEYIEIISNKKVIELPISTTLCCCTTFGKINYYFRAFRPFCPIVCGWFWTEPVILVLRWGYRLGSGPLLHMLGIDWQSRRQSSSSKTAPQLTWRASRRTGCKWTVLGSLKRVIGPKLSRFEPTGLSRLGLEKYHKLLKPKTIDELKVALQVVREEQPQNMFPSLYPHVSTKSLLFWESSTYWRNQRPKYFKLVINISQSSAAAFSRWGWHLNNFCVAYYISILCA